MLSIRLNFVKILINDIMSAHENDLGKILGSQVLGAQSVSHGSRSTQ